MFLVLQNQLPRWLKLGGCSWRSGRADVSSEQKCWGSTLAPEGSAVGSTDNSCAPSSDLPGKVHLPKNPQIKCISEHWGRKAASCCRCGFVPRRYFTAAGEAVPWICCLHWQRTMPGCQGSLGLQAMSHGNFKGSWTFFKENLLSHINKIARFGPIRHIL